MTDTNRTMPHKAFGITNIKSHIPLTLDLDRLNYDSWRELFYTHCEGYDVNDHIDGTHDAPATSPTENEWKKVDSIVKMWLYSTISQALLQMVLKKDAMARQVWLNLEKLFRDNKDARSMQLESELRSITMGDLSVLAYCSKIKKIADLLENLDSDSKVSDKHLVIHTINGLSPRFDYVASIIRHRSPLPSFFETQSMLLLEEQRFKPNLVPQTINHTAHPSSPTILHTGSIDNNRNQSRRNDRRHQSKNR